MIAKNVFKALLLFGLPLIGQAQVNLPNKVEVAMPPELNTTELRKEVAQRIAKQKPAVRNNDTYWTVYSDRANNTTYNGPSKSSGKYSELKFNEVLRIAKIQDGWALVYTDNLINFPAISNIAQTRGWVQMDNLLLWSICPVDVRGIYEKALITMNLDELTNEKLDDKRREYNRLRLNPNDPNLLVPVAADKIFFIMKEEGNRVLLSNAYSLLGNSEGVLQGWIEKSNYTEWNQRACLEPTWDRMSLNNELNGTKIYTYCEPDLTGEQSYWTYSPGDEKRMDPNAFRFPVLNNTSGNENVYKVTVFGRAGNLNDAKNQQAEAIRRREVVMNTIMNINLIVVIDGTQSMGQFYPDVKEAIKEGLMFYKEGYKVRVGVVIYRDKVDKYPVEVLPLTNPDDPRIAAFLDSGGQGGIQSSSLDKTMEEDMFLGLETALDLDKMGYDISHTNIILLVGDCGNDEGKEDNEKAKFAARQEAIVKKMVENNINLFTFQVKYNNDATHAYDKFRTQANKIVNDNMNRHYKEINSKPGSFDENGSGTGRNYSNPNAERELFAGATRYPNGIGTLASGELKDMMLREIGGFAQIVQNQLVHLDNIINNRGKQNETDIAWLEKRFGKEMAKFLTEDYKLLSYTGYTPIATSKGTPYWKPVLFISADELNSLITRLQPAYVVARNDKSDDREPYVNAIKGILRAMIPESDINDADISSITATINKAFFSTGATKLTLNHLLDSNVISPQEYRSILRDFVNKFEKLDKISKQYDHKMTINGLDYYWIPIEDLP